MCSVSWIISGLLANEMACDDDGLSTYGLAVLGAGATRFHQKSIPPWLCFRSRCDVRSSREGQLGNESGSRCWKAQSRHSNSCWRLAWSWFGSSFHVPWRPGRKWLKAVFAPARVRPLAGQPRLGKSKGLVVRTEGRCSRGDYSARVQSNGQQQYVARPHPL